MHENIIDTQGKVCNSMFLHAISFGHDSILGSAICVMVVCSIARMFHSLTRTAAVCHAESDGHKHGAALQACLQLPLIELGPDTIAYASSTHEEAVRQSQPG